MDFLAVWQMLLRLQYRETGEIELAEQRRREIVIATYRLAADVN
jgi:hypothetical protein